MVILREYQNNIVNHAIKILQKHKIVMLAMAVRTGKTHTALSLARKYGSKKILFLSKKKALTSIVNDYMYYKKDFDIVIKNYEGIHLVEDDDFDLIILDEVHSKIAGFPKPSKIYKYLKKRFQHLPCILLSGTPLIESAAKAFPIFSISKYGPFNQYVNFYKWFKDYGIPKKIYTSYGEANDYSDTKYDKIMDSIKHLILTQTQEESGFTTKITEHVLTVKMKDKTYNLIKQLVNDRVIETTKGDILADTGVKIQICLHQLFSGSIKLESGNAITTDYTKGKFIKEYFKGKKIAILTCFIQEVKLLKKVFGDMLTEDLEEFKTTNKSYIGNIIANREGISLREAEALVFYNIPFSGTSFVQGRDRMSYLGREENNVYFICSEGGIEEKILKVVREKKNFTNKIFKNYERTMIPNKSTKIS